MNLTRKQLKAQYDRVVRLGWLPFFEQAAATITKGYFDTADLIAIASRETNLDPKWLTKPGDRGNGFGLMQADKRSFPEFTRGDGWKDAKTGITFGAKVLMQKWQDYEATIGKRVSVKKSTYIGKAASGATAQHIVISSYNCGRWSQFCYARGLDIDLYSTGKDYGRDVMERAAVIRSFLKDSAAAPPPAHSGDQTRDNNNPPQPPIEPSSGAAADPVQVQQVVAEKEPPKAEEPGLLDKINTRIVAMQSGIGTVVTGLITWVSSNSLELTLALFGTAALIGVTLIIATAYRNTKKDEQNQNTQLERLKLEAEERQAREQRQHELQMALVEAGRRQDMNTVVITPPPVEMPSSEV